MLVKPKSNEQSITCLFMVPTKVADPDPFFYRRSDPDPAFLEGRSRIRLFFSKIRPTKWHIETTSMQKKLDGKITSR